MVVNTVGEPHLFEVFFEFFEIFAVAVPGVTLFDGFEGAADAQIVTAVLVEQNVPTTEGCLIQVVDQFFLIERKGVEIGHLVAQHFDVIKTIDHPFERFFCLWFGLAADQSGGDGNYH